MKQARTGLPLPEAAIALFVSEDFADMFLGMAPMPDILISSPWLREQFQGKRDGRPFQKNRIPRVVLLENRELKQAIDNIRSGRRFIQGMPVRFHETGSDEPSIVSRAPYSAKTERPDMGSLPPAGGSNPVVEPETAEERS